MSKQPSAAMHEDFSREHEVKTSSDRSLGVVFAAEFLVIGLCKEQGSKLVIVSLPMDTPDRNFIAEVARAAGARYLPLDKAFANVQEPYTFAHDSHWNARGHEIAADAIERFLKTQAILSASGTSSGG